jgi:hypothetical protein
MVCAGLVVFLGGVVFLNLYGVPDFLLRRIEQKISETGVPVQIESIHLTFQGWRAKHVRCYSRLPDHSDPLLRIHELFLRRNDRRERGQALLRNYDIHANGVLLSSWCDDAVSTENAAVCRIERASVSVGLTSDHILIRKGELVWQNLICNVNGAVGIGSQQETKGDEVAAWLMRTFASQPYQQFLVTLRQLELSDTVVVDIDFQVDAAAPEGNRFQLAAHTGAFKFRDVLFSRFDSAASFAFPLIQLDHVMVQRENERFEIGGKYDLSLNEAQLWVTNSIASDLMFRLMPSQVPELLDRCGIQADSFPAVALQLGPAEPLHLLQTLSGSFDLHHLIIQDLEVNALRGDVSCTDHRVDFSDLQGEVVGQEHRADEVGSCLVGGSVAGSAFWDAAAHEFGVTASGSADPNLFLKPLSISKVATNVIARFRFEEQPPEVQLELGACYDDWRSFYILIDGAASNLQFHRVPFSSISATVDYREGVLSIDRFTARQNVDFVKGSAALDFRNGQARFDAAGHINPRTLEDVIYPPYGIFRRFVKVQGPARVSGQGVVDWRHMQATDFSAVVEAERVELPVAAFDQFSAKVAGKGPEIRVEEAAFELNDGKGSGKFSVVLDPSTVGVPYDVDVTLRNVNFKKFLKYLNPKESPAVSGDLSGRLQAQADFLHRFSDSANGAGRVNIRHGQLADLPLFSGFSKVIRFVIPTFKVFSIHTLEGDFLIEQGMVSSENAYFGGELLSAKGRGSYSSSGGFDAYVQAQVLSDNNFSRFFRFFTDPLLKLFEVKLEGSFKNPEWKLNTFSSSEEKHAEEE